MAAQYISKRIRKWMVIAWLVILFSGISLLFWHNEYVYSLPTPVPVNYHAVPVGEFIDLDGKLKLVENKPIFIHFFNPKCPCSRFNIPHVKSLVKQYGNRISFVIVVISKDSSYTIKEIQNKFDLKIPVLFDQSIAVSCGVYSTPQAVILDTHHKLYYRGNYNKSRYCTDKNSNYAQIALDSLLKNNSIQLFSELATKAYGCQLPACNK
jgi:hypothetical protein